MVDTVRPPSKSLSPAARPAMLRALATIACNQAVLQLDGFVGRLCEALNRLREQPGRAAETEAALSALQHLNRNKATFHRLASAALTDFLEDEVASIANPGAGPSHLERGAMDLSLVTFEAMEQKVLIDNLSQDLYSACADALDALGVRLAHLLQRNEMPLADNPFRPQVFLRAISEAWVKFDLNATSHLVILRQMRPEIFLQLEPVLQALNAALVAQGVLPKLNTAWRLRKSESAANTNERRSLPLYSRLQRWLSPTFGAGDGEGHGEEVAVQPQLLEYLSRLQQQPACQAPAGPAPIEAAILRQIRLQAPAGSLSQADAHAIELLARTLEHLFEEPGIPRGVKRLLAQLQVPLLKAALANRDFFFREDHPARRLLDTVARTSVACDEGKGEQDPLFQMIEKIVERVQREYDQQIELFDDVLKDLESFVAQQPTEANDACGRAVAEAAREEKINRARELAENDVAMRIETGEVAGFVEVFLETQWSRVLGLAHTVQETKPDALHNALKAMDDLIWSVKPKTTAEERKELLAQLPAMLSTLNAWLTVIKWEGQERVKFFATLADRHAAIVRSSVDLSPRQQLEITLNVAQRASERRLNKRAREHAGPVADDFMHLVDGLEPGTWIEFTRESGSNHKTRLAWISPRRTRFVFTGHEGEQPFILSFDELTQAFRTGRALIVSVESMVDRALAAALEEVGQ